MIEKKKVVGVSKEDIAYLKKAKRDLGVSDAEFYAEMLKGLISGAKAFCVDRIQYVLLVDKIAKGELGEVEPALKLAKYDEINYVKGFYILLKDLESELFGDNKGQDSNS